MSPHYSARSKLLIAIACLLGAHAYGASPLQTFTVREVFGVSHPRQIIDFDLTAAVDPTAVHVNGPAGVPVPFQILSGNRLAVEIDALPASGSRTWELHAGAAASPATSVRVLETAQFYEITNGLTGVRLPRSQQTSVPPPAPIQGLQLRDGTWTGTGDNRLPHEAKSMSVRFIERGPLKVVVEIEYRFDRPENRYGETLVSPAGEKRYLSTVTVQHGQPSILFEEDADLEFEYSVNLRPGVEPTQRRYQGHSARELALGRTPSGEAYEPMYDRGNSDALFDFQYVHDASSHYGSEAGPDDWSIRRIAVWDPWRFDAGWWEMAYNQSAGPLANVVGLFAGRASRALGAGDSGAGFFTRAGTGQTRQAGLTLAWHLRNPDGTVYPRVRYQWGFFAGTKGEDLKPAGVQPIHRQMNLHGGFNLAKIHRYHVAYPDSPDGFGSVFMPRSAVDAMIARARTDENYRRQLYEQVPYTRPIIDLWIDPTTGKLSEAIADVTGTATTILDALVNGHGVYEFDYHYWMGGLGMNSRGLWIDQILADPRTGAADRERVKAVAALFSYILWDDDFAPLQDESGLHLGNENMPVQQTGYRNFYALLLAHHPDFAARAREVAGSTLSLLRSLVNEHGAGISSPHYIGASFAPTLNTVMQLKQRGLADAFRTEPRLARFAEFYLQLQTPPEPRLNGKRGHLALGDGSIEPGEMLGVLGTGFHAADTSLSQRLMGMWRESGSPQSDFFGASNFLIDDSLPGTSPALGSAIFPGYMAVLRHAYGTPAESAAWLIAGDFHRDHRHNDHGSLVLYALGQPLSTSWPSIYTPTTGGSYGKSAVVFANSIPGGWNVDGPGLAAGTRWSRSEVEALRTFPDGSYTRSRCSTGQTTWTRELTLVHADAEHPVILIRDTFSGSRAAEDKVLTFNLAAAGSVATPAGARTPPTRTHPANEYTEGQPLPSATAVFPVPAGAQRFGFTGSHAIDFDVYVVAENTQQALLGNWGVTIWGHHAEGRIERQHILRVKGSGTFTTVVVPWRKGRKPAAITVTPSAAGLEVRQNNTTIVFGSGGDYQVATDGNPPPTSIAPVPVLTSPAAGSSFATAASITVSASLSGDASALRRVEFFAGPDKIGEVTTAPYVITWRPAAPGPYSLMVRAVNQDGGSATGNPVPILVQNPTANPGGPPASADEAALVNLSTRATASSERTIIMGFVLSGMGHRTMLIRAVGPTLAEFDVAGPLETPWMRLQRMDEPWPAPLTITEGWSEQGNSAQIVTAAAAAGAFPLPEGSRDLALLASLGPGLYTAEVRGAGAGEGVALVEVYALADSAGTSAELVNLSTRGRVGQGEASLIAGLVVSGSLPRSVFVRAIGPALARFGVVDVVADPVLHIHRAGVGPSIHTNDNWWTGGAQSVRAAESSSGAFPMDEGSADSALIASLDPGAYTIHVGPAVGTLSGEALVEVYLLR